MTEQEIHYLKSSSTGFELSVRAESIRATIKRTFSEKSPHRATLLKELSDLEQSLSPSLPFLSTQELVRIENEIAWAASPEVLANIIDKYSELIRPAGRQEIQEAIRRGQLRWSDEVVWLF